MWGYVRSYIHRYNSIFESVAICMYIYASMIALLIALKYKVNYITAKSIDRHAVYSYTYEHAP